MHIAPQNIGYVAYTNSEQVQSVVGIVTSWIRFHAHFFFLNDTRSLDYTGSYAYGDCAHI